MTWPLPCAEGSLRASCQPTLPTRPSTTLSNPQGASLCGPAASSNSSYVPCYPLLCESRLSTPARHIRSYPFLVKISCLDADSSTVNRGHAHHRLIKRCSVREGRPRRFGGAQ